VSEGFDLERVIDAWRGPLVGLLRARGLGARAAIELAEDVFAEAWLGRERFRGDPEDEGAVGAWLAGIARNLHRAALRRRRFEVLADAAEEREPPENDVPNRTAVRAAIDRLPDGEREVVRMFYLEETSTRRVAALLSLSERAVEGRLRRARQRLAGWLREVQPQ
jgi:RNA polymerase sigma-70 factor (ECF subfamily)